MSIIRLFKRYVLHNLLLLLLICSSCAVPVYTYQTDTYGGYQYPVIAYEHVPQIIYLPSYVYPYYRYYHPVYVDVRINDHKQNHKDHKRDGHHNSRERKR